MKWHLLIAFSFLTLAATSQIKKLNYLEILYDQGHYKKVYKKSNRLLKENSLPAKNSILLFHALSEYMLSQEKSKYSFEKAISNYKEVCVSDTEFYLRNTYGNYIHDLQSGLIDQMIFLEKDGNKKKSKRIYNLYNEIFNNEIPYAKIINYESNNISPYTGTKNEIIEFAKKYLGVPYVYGGTSNKGFDCSGYTQHVYSHFGFTIPRTAQNQSQSLKKIKLKNVKSGDLLFYGKNKNKITHVGIAINKKGEEISMIHASSSKGISITNVKNNSYWEPRLQFAGRVTE